MMYRLIPVIISCLLMAAHFLRIGQWGWVILWLSAPLLLLVKRRWAAAIFQILLLYGAYLWLTVLAGYWQIRTISGQPRLRLTLILAGVAVFTAASALVFFSAALKERFIDENKTIIPSLAAFLLTAVTLGVVQLKVPFSAILLERFLPGGGFLTCFWLACYAGWLGQITQEPLAANKIRPIVWSLFSAVFFSQLIIGLSGMEKFLMTGRLHLPVPALIIAGPLYRGEGLFMLILFGATILLVGPAWCSWLCYIGAWDDFACRVKSRPEALPVWRGQLRIGLLVGIVVAAYILRLSGLSVLVAIYLASAFGLVGVGIMAFWSSRVGVMTHCTAFCPIGVVSTFLGKISPFRLLIAAGCDQCGTCSTACRYDSLSPADLKEGRPAASCTLCGDCVGLCKQNNISYRFLKLSPAYARSLFYVLVVSLHAVFLGVARI